MSCEPPKVNSDPLPRLGRGPDVHTETGTLTRACARDVGVCTTIDGFCLHSVPESRARRTAMQVHRSTTRAAQLQAHLPLLA